MPLLYGCIGLVGACAILPLLLFSVSSFSCSIADSGWRISASHVNIVLYRGVGVLLASLFYIIAGAYA